MWQFYALGAIAFNCLENIMDKRAMRGEVDSIVASFIRVSLYILIVCPIVSLFGHTITWHFDVGFMLFGVLNTFISAAYTIILRRVNITTITMLSYIAPLAFLFIDHMIGAKFSLIQVLAILGLAVGGIAFAMDDRPQLDAKTILALLWMFCCTGGEAFYVKHIHNTTNMDIISVFANIWGWVVIYLGLTLMVTGRWRKLFTQEALTYSKWSVAGKSLDVMNSLLWSFGIAMTTVTQFASMDVFFPPLMLILVLIFQGLLKVDLGEPLHKHTIFRKSCAAIVLVFCSLFV
jgi:hypothetical protein